jgi:hypothetical protein
MASKRCKRRHECRRKKRYDTVAEANSAAWRARCRTQDHIRAYKCRYGNHWHIGHASAGQRSTIEETARVVRYDKPKSTKN